ncbi:hypothetical protein, partial [Myxococcus sp. CA039A]|uniref:hypothetical protein n=1 Tax=Myxococcus sp. CA039A TaxID=2741737 RepID=UPI001C2DB157
MKLAPVSCLIAVLLLGATLPREVLAQEDAKAPTTVQAPPLISAPDDVEPAPFVPQRPLLAEAPEKAGVSTVPRVMIET